MLNLRLREIRKENNLTQQDVAEILNIPKTTYSNYEQGTNEPNISILIKLANYYNVSLDNLLSRKFANVNDAYDDQILKIFKQLDFEHKNKLIGYAESMLNSQKEIKDIKIRTGYRG